MSLLKQLQSAGFTLGASGEQLVVVPGSRLTDDLRADIRKHKAELLANLAIYTPEEADPTYHGLTLSELEAEAADDWQEMQNDPAQLEAFAHALKTTRTRQQGERPDHYTKAAECAVCGPVWLWEGASDNVQGCPWCMNSGPVPRPGPVLCRDCSHWVPDTINPPGGLGQCEKNVPGLAWPWRKLGCSQYRTSFSPSIA